jgi:Na+-transporting methylmalonyl-CoA/oxaloacetate decarboxylase gamma subunit
MLKTQNSSSVSRDNDSETVTQPAPRSEQTRSGEDAVRRAAEVVVNRSAEGGDKRVRRRSRRTRSTPILAGTGLQFHYGVGLLMLFTLILVIFNEQISKAVWKILHPPAPPPVPGAAGAGPVVPDGPAPWWFHVEIPALLVGFAIWLYLTPGVWDSLKSSLGLQKNKERRSRKRHT